VYKKGDCLVNVAYKVFVKVLHSRLLPYGIAVVQNYEAGILTVRQINKTPAILSATDVGKSNEFNITTHHLFIDFKAA
jgi:hypothetical protein